MSEGKKKDRNYTLLSFHTLSDDSSEENEFTKPGHTTVHEYETHRKTSSLKRGKSSRTKRARATKFNSFVTPLSEMSTTHNIVNLYNKTLQHIQHENKLTYEISLLNSTKVSSTTTTSSTTNTLSRSTITTPEYALSYANNTPTQQQQQQQQRKYTSQENDIPKLVYEKDIKDIKMSQSAPTKTTSSTTTTTSSSSNNNNKRVCDDSGCSIESSSSSLSSPHSCWGDDISALYEDFYENDDIISTITGRGLRKSILGELGVIPGFHYPLRSAGFGNPASTLASQMTINGGGGNNSSSINNGNSNNNNSSNSNVNGGIGLNVAYREALNAILRNEFGRLDDSEGSRVDVDGNYEYYDDDDYDDDDDDDFYDGDEEDEKFDFFDYDNNTNEDDSSSSNDNESNNNNNSERKHSVLKNTWMEKKRKREDVSFYYEVAGYSLLEDEEKNDKSYDPIANLVFSQRETPLPLIPELSRGSDSESDEDVRFAWNAKDEIEESIQIIKQLEEAEKARKELELAQIAMREKEKEMAAAAAAAAHRKNSLSQNDSLNSGKLRSDSLSNSLSNDNKMKDDKSSTSTSPSSSVLASEAASDNDDDSVPSFLDDKQNGKQSKKPQRSAVRAKKCLSGKRCGSTLCKQSLIKETNDNYLELKCTAGCKFYLHPKCSKKVDAVRKIENSGQFALDIFSTQCPTPDCWGTLVSINYYNKLDLERNIDLSEAAAAAAAEAVAIKNAEAKAAPKLSKKSMKRKLRASEKALPNGLSSSTTEEINTEQTNDTEREDDDDDDDSTTNNDNVDDSNENDKKKEETPSSAPTNSSSQTPSTTTTKTTDEKEQNDKDKDDDKDKNTDTNKENETSIKPSQQQQQQQPTSETTTATTTTNAPPTPKKNHKKKKKSKNGNGAVNSPLTTPAPPIQVPINNEWANADAILKIKNGPSGISSSSSSVSTSLASSSVQKPSSASSSSLSPTASTPQLGLQQDQHSSSASGIKSSLSLPPQASAPPASSSHNQSFLDGKDGNSPTTMAADSKMTSRGDEFKLNSHEYAEGENKVGYSFDEGNISDDHKNGNIIRYKSIYSIFLPYDYGDDEKFGPLECPVWPEWSPFRSVINVADESFVVDLTENDSKICSDLTNFKSFFGTTFGDNNE